MLVDTGAAMSLLATDVVVPVVLHDNHIMPMCGLTGTINTHGNAYIKLITNGKGLDARINLIDRKYALNGDGYIGIDFIRQFKMIIDIPKKKVTYRLK